MSKELTELQTLLQDLIKGTDEILKSCANENATQYVKGRKESLEYVLRIVEERNK